MKTVFRIMPLVIFPLTINFPTVSESFAHICYCSRNKTSLKPLFIFFSLYKLQAVFTYWLTSNCFSLCQVALLRHPLIRKKLKIPERIKHPASALPQSDGLIESMKKGRCHEHKSVVEESRTINLVAFDLLNKQHFVSTLIVSVFVRVETGLVCRLEERPAGPPAGRARAKNKKSSGPRCQRSVPVFS